MDKKLNLPASLLRRSYVGIRRVLPPLLFASILMAIFFLDMHADNDQLKPLKGRNWTVSGLNLKMIYVEPGTFMMGSPNGEKERDPDEALHKVTLTYCYWVSDCEVIQADYRAVTGENPSNFKDDGLPVESVNWHDAVKFCGKLNRREMGSLPQGFVYRLPSEAEWEYAARGGIKSRSFKYSGGDDLPSVGWYAGNSEYTTHRVGMKAPNEVGICDMSGNVAEWCGDWYGKYADDNQVDPFGADELSSYRVVRGGSWDSSPRGCRVTDRDFYLPDSPNINTGFRIVLAPLIGKVNKVDPKVK